MRDSKKAEKNLTTSEILHHVHQSVPLLGPCSIVVTDNLESRLATRRERERETLVPLQKACRRQIWKRGEGDAPLGAGWKTLVSGEESLFYFLPTLLVPTFIQIRGMKDKDQSRLAKMHSHIHRQLTQTGVMHFSVLLSSL